MSLFSDMDPQNIIFGCWEFNLDMNLVKYFHISCCTPTITLKPDHVCTFKVLHPAHLCRGIQTKWRTFTPQDIGLSNITRDLSIPANERNVQSMAHYPTSVTCITKIFNFFHLCGPKLMILPINNLVRTANCDIIELTDFNCSRLPFWNFKYSRSIPMCRISTLNMCKKHFGSHATDLQLIFCHLIVGALDKTWSGQWHRSLDNSRSWDSWK